MNFSLLFVLLSLFSVTPCPTWAQDGKRGRELSFPAYYFFADKRFVNYTIKRIIVKDLDECEHRCYLNADCVSLNIKNKDPTSGTHECELNNSTHLEHDGYLKDNKLFYYRGAENKCGKYRWKYCKNNSTCQSGFTHKGYRCSCITGFEGKHCEKDIDECVAQVNPCNAVANSECKNTHGSYDCHCKDGFVKNDRNCEVDICKNYHNLTDAERKYDYVTVHSKCDDTLNGWYRFQGAAGTKMVTTCPSGNRCDASFPAWLSGDHPTVAEGTVTRKVCVHRFGDCCETSVFIQVKNCGPYYIYKLKYPGACSSRYCGTDLP